MTDEQDGGPVNGGYLGGVRVVELADETGEYAGKLLAGLGADVVKLEPPEGNATRKIGPFYGGVPHPDRSLYFWHYNFGKRGLTIDPASERGRLLDLLAGSDVFLETTPRGYLDGLGVTYEAARQANPGLVWVRITPFGDTGPWSEYKGSDLVHLALGGVMMNCGYDPDPITGSYDTPPIAPQMWHAYHVAGQITVMAASSGRSSTATPPGRGKHCPQRSTRQSPRTRSWTIPTGSTRGSHSCGRPAGTRRPRTPCGASPRPKTGAT